MGNELWCTIIMIHKTRNLLLYLDLMDLHVLDDGTFCQYFLFRSIRNMNYWTHDNHSLKIFHFIKLLSYNFQ